MARADAIDSHLRVIVNALPSLVAYYDRELVCREANGAYLGLFDAPNAVVGSRLATHASRDVYGALVDVALAGDAITEVRRFAFPRGERLFEARLVPHRDAGAVVGFTIVLADLTEQQRMDRTRAFFNEAIVVLESEGEPALVWQRIADQAVINHADWCTIHVRRGDGISYLAAAAHRVGSELAGLRAIAEQRGVASGSVVDDVLAGRPARRISVDVVPDPFGNTTAPLTFDSAIVVPLVGRDGGSAAMTIAVRNPLQTYTAGDVALADDLSRRFGLAASNARLYRAEQRARKAAERAVERTTRLQAITAQLVGALDTEAIGTIIVGQAIAAMRAHAGCMVMPSSDGAYLELLHAHGYGDDQIDGYRIIDVANDTPLARAYRSGRPVWLHALDDHQREFPGLVAPNDTNALCAIPLVTQERPTAVLGLSFVEAQTFTPEDQSFLYALARQGAQAIERARLHREARDADRRKDEFLAMLSHELRNPLAPMLTGIQLIRETPDDAQSERLLATVERQVHHLARLVDDLLDVSRFTRGKIELKRTIVELGPIAKAAADAAAHIMTSRRHTFNATIADDLWVDVDPVRIEQVLANLLNNAAKYTEPAGTITLTVTREGKEAVVRVHDNGMGIPADVVPHVFEPFMQASRALDRAQGGLGIGLTMVKRIAEMHDGRVAAYSAGVGEGSEFTVRLPCTPSTTRPLEVRPAAAPRASVAAGTSLRVLVVDDNVDAAESLAQLLTLWGHRVEVAGDGPAALRIASALGPELVLLDIGLPGMDGYQVAAALRATDPRTAGTRVIAVSGYGQARDRERSREAGFDAHLTKPVDIARLRQLVADIARIGE